MADDDARKLFVAGLSDSITEDVLRGLFVGTGAASADVNIPRDRMTGRPRGFAFVILGSAEEAANARKLLDGSLQAGRPMAVRPFRADGSPGRDESRSGSDGQSTEERTLYVRNLPYEATREEVTALFKSVGVEEVDRVHLPVGPDGRGKGFGFVTLRNAAAAQQALSTLQNTPGGAPTLRGRAIAANIARGREERDRDRSFAPPSMRDMPPPPLPRGEGRREPRRFEHGPEEGAPEGEDAAAAGARAAKNKKAKRRSADGARDRRRDEGMRSPRTRAQIDDWDDD